MTVDVERRALGDLQLQLDEVEARHELGHGVLDLQARVDLEEVEPLVGSTTNSTVPAFT